MDIPEKIKSGMAHWLFGCDICQDVCPWNRFARETQISHFYPVSALQKKVPDFQEMTESEFDSGFKKTPLQRPGLVGMRRNQQTTS
jgi:epoxyqueuosine reductase